MTELTLSLLSLNTKEPVSLLGSRYPKVKVSTGNLQSVTPSLKDYHLTARVEIDEINEDLEEALRERMKSMILMIDRNDIVSEVSEYFWDWLTKKPRPKDRYLDVIFNVKKISEIEYLLLIKVGVKKYEL